MPSSRALSALRSSAAASALVENPLLQRYLRLLVSGSGAGVRLVHHKFVSMTALIIPEISRFCACRSNIQFNVF